MQLEEQKLLKSQNKNQNTHKKQRQITQQRSTKHRQNWEMEDQTQEWKKNKITTFHSKREKRRRREKKRSKRRTTRDLRREERIN